mmetsp:Transcript_35830/g.54921  ORF Transcript_35830/g.54921 Transcript_35830/m.54921 type:complete len:89 (+) Transcript_35830:1-267(+)
MKLSTALVALLASASAQKSVEEEFPTLCKDNWDICVTPSHCCMVRHKTKLNLQAERCLTEEQKTGPVSSYTDDEGTEWSIGCLIAHSE